MEPTTAALPPSEPVPPRRRFSVRPRGVFVGLVAVAVVAGVAWVLHGRNRLDRALAELDRTEPGWRMHDIWAEYQRTLPPDEKNSFLVVDAAAKVRPTGFSSWTAQPIRRLA